MKRGLILGGGGVLGLAWEIGLLHGLCGAGINLRGAHEVIGTSAGAFAGAALLDHRGIAWAYQRQIAASVREVAVASSVNVIERLTEILRQCAGDDREAGRRIGVFSLENCMIDQKLRLAVVRERLDREDWPSDHLNFTAVDMDSGELHLLNRDSGIDLVHAAAASGAAPGIWPVVQAKGRRWVDGGSVSVTNAYLASRFDECIVVSPRPTNLSGIPVQAEIDGCGKRDGALLIVPDVRSEAAIGQNNFDPMRRRAAAEAGHQQGLRFASEIAQGWRAAPTGAPDAGALQCATS
jgi:NTE family protein